MPKKLTGAPRTLALLTLVVALGLSTWMFVWMVLWAPTGVHQ